MKPYIGLKLKGLSYWVWFEVKHTETNGMTFTGKKGWGKNREDINLSCNVSEIEGRIESDNIG